MNAANEVAVAAFLADGCGYLDIDRCVEAVMEAHEGAGVQRVESLEQLEDMDAWARAQARAWLASSAFGGQGTTLDKASVAGVAAAGGVR